MPPEPLLAPLILELVELVHEYVTPSDGMLVIGMIEFPPLQMVSYG